MTRLTSEVAGSADEVGADRQLWCPRSTRTASWTARGRPMSLSASRPPGWCGRRTARRRRARLCAVDPAGRDLGGEQRARAGFEAQVVAVHRDVERADRHVVPPRRRSARRSAARVVRRGWGCPAGRDRRRPCCARGSRGRCGQRLARCRARRGRRAPQVMGCMRVRRQLPRTSLLRLTGRLVKGCRSLEPYLRRRGPGERTLAFRSVGRPAPRAGECRRTPARQASAMSSRTFPTAPCSTASWQRRPAPAGSGAGQAASLAHPQRTVGDRGVHVLDGGTDQARVEV